MSEARLYLLEGGRVRARPITRPTWVPGLDTVAAGAAEPGALAGVLPALAAEAARVVPWARVYVAPELWMPANGLDDYSASVTAETRDDARGRRWTRIGGVARYTVEVAALSPRSGVHGLAETLHHECWHLLSRRLPAADREPVYAAARGGALPLGSDYADSDEERAARLYAAWSSAWLHGLPPRPGVVGAARCRRGGGATKDLSLPLRTGGHQAKDSFFEKVLSTFSVLALWHPGISLRHI